MKPKIAPRTYYIIKVAKLPLHFKHNTLVWLRKFIEIFDALCCILTFTLWKPTYSWSFLSWSIKQELKDWRDNENTRCDSSSHIPLPTSVTFKL